ncbi:BNR repeat-like domain-containing protein [Actinacidiphila yanglinensis]|uniref:exo-alpha-sialidase n=1 Tax=Actinacidiphila yanglinensis TaxID=310779 RepID=A0A1H5XY76_9ACTN|nr:exo-alpha-sialidase [Actinacidiphila yanglinensis]SEG16310.1 BNR repeat-like domain-containing protein [Actinacidiphila yanglinensis]
MTRGRPRAPGAAAAGPGRRALLVASGLSAVSAGAALCGAGPAVAEGTDRTRYPAAAGAGAGRFAESVVWAAGEDAAVEHFLYGLVVTARGTVLACSEARLDPSDTGAHHIAVKRSTDGGGSWPASVLVERGTDGRCWANPTLVADPVSGRVMLFYALNSGNDSSRVFFRASRDDGRTWSDRTEVTGLFAADPRARPFHLPGPGHGLCLRDGRLLVQVWHRESVTLPVAARAYGASVLVSDDHGVTWRAGGTLPVDPAYPVNESRLFERSDGAVVLEGRCSSGGVRPRITSVSRDRGGSWAPPVFDPAVRSYTSVDSGMARLSGGYREQGVSRLLFSRPDSTTARQNLTVGVSYDEGRSFPYEKVVYPGPAGYSDLAHFADGTVLVLYGKDTSEGRPVDHVALARFDLAWLTGGRDSNRTGPRWHEHRYDAASLAMLHTDRLRAARSAADPYTAAGRGLLLRCAGPGASVTFRLDVPAPGRYELVVRCRLRPGGPSLTALLDGRGRAAEFSTDLADGIGYGEFSAGRHVLTRAGAHTLTLTVVAAGTGGAGAGSGGDADVELDYLALRA